VATEITSLRAEIDRIANATTFNGANLLTGALSVTQNTAATGSLAVGTTLNTGHAAAVSAIDVSGAKASTTYTMTANGGNLTLSDGSGNGQTLALATTIGATGIETINFNNLGVKLTVTGNTAKTDAELAGDLAAAGTITKSIGGAAATDLVNGDVLSVTSNAAVLAGLGVKYGDILASPGLWATASAGVGPGTFTLSGNGSGHMTGSVGGENFSGDLPVVTPGNAETVVLLGNRGNTITLSYTTKNTGLPPSMGGEDWDMNGATFAFTANPGSATVIAMTAAPAAAAGIYTFTSAGGNSLTLNGTGGPYTQTIANMGSGAVRMLTFGNVSFTLTADSNGFTGVQIATALTQPQDDTIIVNASAPGPTNNIVVTGTGAAANFQVGANAADSMAVSFANARLNSTSTSAAGYGNLDAAITAFATATTTTGGSGIVAAAQALITSVDTAIGYVSKTRGDLGAVQNRLEHTTAAISVASENLNASESRIRDLDVASEMVNFTKTQILQQAGTAILAQANSAPQNILTLLR
jgi:flagellin-like hook-associated protein FlgL